MGDFEFKERQLQGLGDSPGVRVEIVEVLAENCVDHGIVNPGVSVHQEVAEARHLQEPWKQVFLDQPLLSQHSERIAVVLRGPIASLRDEVVPDIQAGFNGEVQKPLRGPPNQLVCQIFFKGAFAELSQSPRVPVEQLQALLDHLAGPCQVPPP